MKKLLFALVLGAALVLALASAASADNGPHGSFTATTDACASCHRAHSAQFGSNDLLIMAPQALCMSCHDGTGAGTNVHDGVYSQSGADTYYGGGVNEGTDGASLFGGGFTNALMATAWSGNATFNAGFNATSRATTSAHNIGVTGTIWGSGAINSANGGMVLECTSCHNPHGTAGFVHNTTTRTATYRLLRFQPQGSQGFSVPASSVNWSGGAFPTNGAAVPGVSDRGWTVPDNFATIGTEWYTIGTQTTLSNCGQTSTSPCGQPFAVGDYNAGNVEIIYQPVAGDYRPAARATAYFCAQCHDRYFANSSLRNNTEASVYCGAPSAQTVNGVVLTVYPNATGLTTPPYIHPVDSVRCQPVLNTAGTALIRWGDNGSTGDSAYTYMHSSGDVLRASMDGTVAASTNARVSRSCVACHVSHGTTAQMTAFASDATLAAVAGNDTNNSTLLRMDNRSLCLRCHTGPVNFTVGP